MVNKYFLFPLRQCLKDAQGKFLLPIYNLTIKMLFYKLCSRFNLDL